MSSGTRGGARVGAGRKKRADELIVAEKFRNVMEDDEVIEKLAAKVRLGELKAIELWMGYIYGKPRQIAEIKHLGDINDDRARIVFASKVVLEEKDSDE